MIFFRLSHVNGVELLILFVDNSTFWYEFLMDDGHGNIKKQSGELGNLTVCFFKSCLLTKLQLGLLNFCFNILSIHPLFITIYDMFE